MLAAQLKEKFEQETHQLAIVSHGVAQLESLKTLIKSVNKATRLLLFDEYFLRAPVKWDDVKDSIWETEEKRTDNKFHFLQGDIIETTMVEGIGSSNSGSSHDLWLILSPDCDCVRGTIVSVAPIFCHDPTSNEVDNKKKKDAFALSTGLGTLKFFPLSESLFRDGDEGFYADLTEPYFLRTENKRSAVVHFSMKKYGWHILNSVLKHKDTRAIDIQEGISLREAPVTESSDPQMEEDSEDEVN